MNVKLANMNEVVVSDEKHPIVGTFALATCYGILLYDVKNKKAYLAHVSSDYMPVLAGLIDEIVVTKPTFFKYLVVPGNYNTTFERKKEIEEILNRFMTNDYYFIPFDIDYRSVITIDYETDSSNIAFNAKTGKFVTKSVDFSTEGIKRIFHE